MPDIFVSYSRRDEDFVRTLVQALEERGKDVWRDKDDIPPAVEWREEIRQGIDGSDVFTFVLSPDSLTSRPCSDELSHAVGTGKTIVPVVRRSPDGAAVPDELSRLNYVFARDGDDFAQAVDQLVAAIDGLPAWERTHTRLLLRAGEWDAKGRRDKSLLLRGGELHDAEQWSAERPEGRQPTQLELDYLLASRRASTRRLRTLVAVALAALAVTAGLGVVALLQRNDATRQRNAAVRERNLALSRSLGDESTSLVDRRLDLAALLALESYRTAPTAVARGALVSAMERSDHVTSILPGRYKTIGAGGRGRRLALMTHDGAISVWDIARGRMVGVPVHVRSIASVGSGAIIAGALALAPDGWRVAANDGVFTVWDAQNGNVVAAPRHSAVLVDGLTFNSRGTRLATAGQPTATIWTVARHPRGHNLPGGGSDEFVQSLAFSPRDRILAASGDTALHRWLVRGWRPLPPVSLGSADESNVAFSPDGTTLATSASHYQGGGKIMLWRPTGRRPFRIIRSRRPVASLAFVGARTLVAVDGGRLLQLDVDLPRSRLEPVSPYARGLADVVASRPGTFASRADDGTVRLWSLRAALAREVYASSVEGVALSPNGRTVAAVERNGSVRLWNTRGGRPDGPPVVSRRALIDAAAFAGDHVLATGEEDGSVAFHDLTRPRPHAHLPRVRFNSLSVVAALAASKDGKWAASIPNEGPISIWNVKRRRKTGELALPLGSQGSAVAFAPNGETVAAATRATAGFHGSLGLWNVSTRTRDGRLFGAVLQNVSALAFSSNGRVLASAEGGIVRLWDVASRKPLGGVLRIGSQASSLSFFSDGGTLAVGEPNGISLWDVTTRTRLGDVIPANGAVNTVAFSSDGRVLASDGGGVFLWSPFLWSRQLDVFSRRLCRLAGRNLTPAEWRQYLPGEPYRQTCASMPG